MGPFRTHCIDCDSAYAIFIEAVKRSGQGSVLHNGSLPYYHPPRGRYEHLFHRTAPSIAVFWTNLHFLGRKHDSISGVHPSGWTGRGPENRLTEPGFRGESPWPSTAHIRSSLSARSCRSSWAESRPMRSPSATASAAT